MTAEYGSAGVTEAEVVALYRRLDGRNGRAAIPRLGSPVAIFSAWTLTRRDEPGETDLYDLLAICSMAVAALIKDPEYGPEVVVTVQLGKGQTYRLDQPGGQRMALLGKTFRMEKVRLCHLDQ